jgi:transposase-like protein
MRPRLFRNCGCHLQVLKLPRAHHKRLRTANLLAKTFGENKRRTKVIPHFFTDKAALKLTYAVLLAVANKWRGVRMDVFTARQVEEFRKKTLIDSVEKQSAA